MSKYALDGATIKCTMGDKSAKLRVTSQRKYKVQGKKVATMMDFMPGANYLPVATFGTCKPYKALPPPAQLCTPIPTGPWLLANLNQKIQGKPALLESSCLICGRVPGAMIQIKNVNQ